MKVSEIKNALEISRAWESEDFRPAEFDILTCYASDLVSDMLTFNAAGSILLTGLTNPQVVRTAEILELVAICFVHGKQPHPEAVRLALEKRIPLYTTELTMYEACGRLLAKGLAPCARKES